MFFIFILLWLWFFVLRFVLDVLVCGQGIHREEQLVPSRRVGLKWWAQAARRAIIFVRDGKAVGLCSCVLPWIWCCGGWSLSRRDVSNSIRTINNTNTTYLYWSISLALKIVQDVPLGETARAISSRRTWARASSFMVVRRWGCPVAFCLGYGCRCEIAIWSGCRKFGGEICC
jgi:hypothetical protein